MTRMNLVARFHWLFILACFVTVLTAGITPKAAFGQRSRQVPASEFSELRALVQAGDSVVVRIENGEEIRANVITVDSTRNVIVLDADEVRLSLPESSIREIHLRVRDPLGNGALQGIGIGLGTALLFAAISDDGGGGRGFLAFSLFTIPIGAAVGVGIDSMHAGRQLVFERPLPLPGKLLGPDHHTFRGFRFSFSVSW